MGVSCDVDILVFRSAGIFSYVATGILVANELIWVGRVILTYMDGSNGNAKRKEAGKNLVTPVT